jgi:hypothetical protein
LKVEKVAKREAKKKKRRNYIKRVARNKIGNEVKARKVIVWR